MIRRGGAQNTCGPVLPRIPPWIFAAFLSACLAACDSSPTQPPPAGSTVTWTRITDPASIPEPDHPAWRGDSIAFDYEDTLGLPRIGYISSDGNTSVLFTDPVASRDLAPAWVTDRLLVYSSNKFTGAQNRYDLWYRNLANGTTRRLTAFIEPEFGPTPRPGLSSLLYTEGPDPTRGRVTLIPDTSATTLTRLYLTPANLVAGEASWDSSGDRVCFSVEDTDGSRHIWMLTLAGTTVTSSVQLTTGAIHDSSPRFSPDGSRILFVSDRNARSGVWWVSDTGSANGLDLIAFEDPGAEIRSPSWSPDGTRIVLSSDGRGGRALWVLSDLGL